jgi:hypothetical protein
VNGFKSCGRRFARFWSLGGDGFSRKSREVAWTFSTICQAAGETAVLFWATDSLVLSSWAASSPKKQKQLGR